MCRMNPRVSPQHQVATVNQVPGMQDNAGLLGGGGKAMPLDMPQGKNKRPPKSLAGTLKLLWELLCECSSGEESGNFALIKGIPI